MLISAYGRICLIKARQVSTLIGIGRIKRPARAYSTIDKFELIGYTEC